MSGRGVCSVNGCGRACHRKCGLCNSHYRRFSAGQMSKPIRSLEPRSEKKCSYPGCDRSVKAYSLCQSHRNRQIAGSIDRPIRKKRKNGSQPIFTLVDAECEVEGLAGSCMEVPGNPKEYVYCTYRGRTFIAHRFLWEGKFGKIADGMVIDHVCRNRRCLNLNHLRVVTVKVNNTENVVGSGWQVMAAKTHCPKGHPYSPENTRTKSGSRQCRTCGRDRDRERYRRLKGAVL